MQGIRTFHGVNFMKSIQVLPVSGHRLSVFKSNDPDEDRPWYSPKKDLIIAIHDLNDIPQSWSYIINKLGGQYAYWAPTIPGTGEGSPLKSCLISESSKLLGELVLMARDSGRYNNIHMVGHGWGGLLAWQVTQIVPPKTITNLVSIAASHPVSEFSSLRNMRARDAYFYPFLNPLNDAYLSRDDFAGYKKMYENETWWNNDWEEEYTLHWYRTGASSMNCYYRDNFPVNNLGSLSVAEIDLLTRIDPDVNVLIIGGEKDPKTTDAQLQHTRLWLQKKVGRSVQYHRVQGGGRQDMLHNVVHAQETSRVISAFAIHTSRIVRSFWKFQSFPFFITGDEFSYNHDDKVVVGCLFGAFCLVMWGLALEYHLGRYYANNHNLWRFSQVVLAPVCLTAALSCSWTFSLLYAAAMFKFGYPEILVTFAVAFHNNLDAGEDLHVPVSKWQRCLLFMDAIAALLHHFGANLICLSLAAGVLSPAMFIYPALPTALQHFCGGTLKYYNDFLYVVVALLLDIWFQSEALVIIPISSLLPQIAMIFVMSAHNLWIFTGLIGMIGKKFYVPEVASLLTPSSSKKARRRSTHHAAQFEALKHRISFFFGDSKLLESALYNNNKVNNVASSYEDSDDDNDRTNSSSTYSELMHSISPRASPMLYSPLRSMTGSPRKRAASNVSISSMMGEIKEEREDKEEVQHNPLKMKQY